MTPFASETPEAPTTALSPYAAARPLRRFLGRHNRQALLLAGLSLGAAILLWAAVYGFAYWFTLVTFTVHRSFQMESVSQINDARGINVWFPAAFAVGAILWLIVAAIIKRFYRADKIREAQMYLVWIFLELFMAVPNVTFSIWGNLRAMTRLGKAEVAEAWWLLQRMNEHEGRLSLSSLRLEIEDERTLCRVVFALQIIGVVGMRENDRGWFLYLQGQEVRTLLSQTA